MLLDASLFSTDQKIIDKSNFFLVKTIGENIFV